MPVRVHALHCYRNLECCVLMMGLQWQRPVTCRIHESMIMHGWVEGTMSQCQLPCTGQDKN